MGIDIVVPVWNRPFDTRTCLVNLINHSPGARLILLDNGCERETERLLQEFAEALDHQALLVCTGANQGLVKSVNIGLARSTAEFTAIVRNTSQVTEGWLEPLIELAEARPEAGLIIPRLVETGGPSLKKCRTATTAPTIEVPRGSFAAMLIRKELYNLIGGFDEEMDGGFWCLNDYSRRAYRAGFLTFTAQRGVVQYSEETLLGSEARREEIAKRSAACFTNRWGEEKSFGIYFPKGAQAVCFESKRGLLLKGARQGHIFAVLVHQPLHRELIKAGYDRLHQNIRLEPLPLLFAERGANRIMESLYREMPEILAVAGIDGIPFPNAAYSMPFARVAQIIEAIEAEKYGRR